MGGGVPKKVSYFSAITKGFLWVGEVHYWKVCVEYENDESATNLISFRYFWPTTRTTTTRTCSSSITVCLRVQKMRSKLQQQQSKRTIIVLISWPTRL